jgi:hypothetical protein
VACLNCMYCQINGRMDLEYSCDRSVLNIGSSFCYLYVYTYMYVYICICIHIFTAILFILFYVGWKLGLSH